MSVKEYEDLKQRRPDLRLPIHYICSYHHKPAIWFFCENGYMDILYLDYVKESDLISRVTAGLMLRGYSYDS